MNRNHHRNWLLSFTALSFLTSCQSAPAQENLLPDNLDWLPNSTTNVPGQGNLQSPAWAYNVWDAASKGVLSVGEAPAGGKGISVVNLGPQNALQLYTPEKELGAGSYQFSVDLFAAGEAAPLVKLNLSEKPTWGDYSAEVADGPEQNGGKTKLFVGKPTGRTWKTLTARFTLAQSAKLDVNFQNGKTGEANALWVKSLNLVKTANAPAVAAPAVAAPAGAAPATQNAAPATQNAAPAQSNDLTTQSTRGDYYQSLKFREWNALPPGQILLGGGDDTSARDALYAVNQNGANMTLEQITATGARFKDAVRLVVPNDPKDADTDYWHSFARFDAGVPVSEGDALWLTFWARSGNEKKARFQAAVKHQNDSAQKGRPDGGLIQLAEVGSEWTQFMMPMRARASDKPRFELYTNYRAQTLEIGGFAFVNFKTAIGWDKLPQMALDLNYKGREANAPWRKAALKRIEAIRKGPLKISVLDKNGKPVSGAKVQIRQTKSAFPFGSHVPTHMFPGNWPPTDSGGYSNTNFHHRSMDAGAVGQQYRRVVKENFEIVTTGFGWRFWADDKLRGEVLDGLAMWRREGLAIKNHVLLYPREDLLPDSVVKMNRADAVSALWKYIDEVVPVTREDVAVYDVMNEPFGSLVYQLKHGSDQNAYFQMQADLFNRVKKLAPNAQIALNEAGQDTSDEQNQKFLKWASELLNRGAQIDEFGVQAHVAVMAPPEEILKRFDALSAMGQKINISEFDVKIGEKKTPEIQAYEADVLRDYLILAFSHPKVNHFIMWGFWDGDHWIGNGPLFNLDWTPKPAYKVWKDLVLTNWRTSETLTTGKDGAASIRGFKGDYEVTVSAGGKTRTAKTSIGKNGVLKVVFN